MHLCRLPVPSGKLIDAEVVNVPKVKWIIMLLYSLTIQFRVQHEILLRDPVQMS
jgi:hypothetical protein